MVAGDPSTTDASTSAPATGGSQSESNELLAITEPAERPTGSLVRLGFLGLGWIGLNRMKAVCERPDVEVAAVADASSAAIDAALAVCPRAVPAVDLRGLLAQSLDGIVIATPSGQHAAQVLEALEQAVPVFCQKPLTGTARQAEAVIERARAQDVLLAVDYSYRHVMGMNQLRQLVHSGELGQLYSIDLTFHNAYAPNQGWAHDLTLSGGGCVIDLATHLIDLALWATSDLPCSEITSRLYRGGQPLSKPPAEVEDAAFCHWLLGDSIDVRLVCSWNASMGCDAVIRAAFHGSAGSAVLRNVAGSFYDFVIEHHQSTHCTTLAGPPDAWGGRALQRWVERLQVDPRFDPEVRRCLQVAAIIDTIYGRGG